MKIIMIMLMSISLYAFSAEQEKTLEFAYQFGKRYGLENTIRAIVMKESSGGIHLKNKHINACGIAQILVRTWKRRYRDDIAHLHISDDAICSLLKRDDELNLLAAVEEIKFWQHVHGKNAWNKIYASYYAGYNYSSSEGKEYAKKVIKWIKFFKRYDKQKKWKHIDISR